MKARNLILATALGGLVALTGENLPSLSGETAVQQAAAQQMGRQGWGYSRNKSMAAQFQHVERENKKNRAGGGGGGGGGSVTQYVTNYNTSSTAIGNYTQIEQILSDGAQGSLDYLADQDSSGNQGADSLTDLNIDNSVGKNSRGNRKKNKSEAKN
ncbi:hypothetical protein [Aquibaculum sediminis]|uniref:hypothetical protein n=1 Tax=Aquibaculum sediminis TaxID=3231907 RepID=UPI0034540BAE